MSFEVCGRLCERVTPRSASSSAVAPRLRRGRLGLHRAAAIGVQGQLAGEYAVLGDGVIEQRAEQRGGLGVGDTPADDAAAEDVENDVEIEVTPLVGPFSLVISQDQTSLGRWAISSGFR